MKQTTITISPGIIGDSLELSREQTDGFLRDELVTFPSVFECPSNEGHEGDEGGMRAACQTHPALLPRPLSSIIDGTIHEVSTKPKSVRKVEVWCSLETALSLSQNRPQVRAVRALEQNHRMYVDPFFFRFPNGFINDHVRSCTFPASPGRILGASDRALFRKF